MDVWSLGITISELYFYSVIKEEMFNDAILYNPFKENLVRTEENVKQFYTGYIENDVSLPNIMPSFLKKVVRKILVPDPKHRISFENIYVMLL